MGRKRLPKLDVSVSSGDEAPARKAPRKKELAKYVAASSSHKDENPVDESVDLSEGNEAAKDFENYVFDMWLRNKESATFVQTLSQKATKAGAKGVENIQNICNLGTNRNMSRDLRRQAKARAPKDHPPPYYAGIPCWNAEKGECDIWDIPFFLPIELLWYFISSGAIGLALLCKVVTGTAMATIKNEICRKLQVEPETHVIVGLHSDGVPMQKSGQTIEVQSFNFPNLPQCERSMWNVLGKRFLLQMRMYGEAHSRCHSRGSALAI